MDKKVIEDILKKGGAKPFPKKEIDKMNRALEKRRKKLSLKQPGYVDCPCHHKPAPKWRFNLLLMPHYKQTS